MYRPISYLISCCLLFFTMYSSAQPLNKKEVFTRQDTLRGSNGPGRAWWDVWKYDLEITPDFATKTIRGKQQLQFTVHANTRNKQLQLDLQVPMKIDSVQGYPVPVKKYRREGNVYFLEFEDSLFRPGKTIDNIPASYSLTIYFSGKPREAVNPPWDGGWIWTKDQRGRPWMTVACQGLGASVWYPCKDYQGDEPDKGASLSITIPDTLVAVGNGRLINKQDNRNGSSTWTWAVTNPINSYNIVPYIGMYVHLSDQYTGENGKALSLDYWVLDYEKEKARKQFDRDVKRMLDAFEYWFGSYPFYEDGYKLVESPHLGMEHQSAIAYGNYFMDGYMGMDLSNSGWGKKWDYIIIHESGHEWFANNITSNDIADMWIHEGFTMYSEVLFIEYHYGRQAADEYLQGIRKDISNDRPLIGPAGVNKEGSDDMYNKGASLIHTIRQLIGNDTLFRHILRGLNQDFRLQTIDSKDLELYFIEKTGIDLQPVFDQYLRTTKIPVLEYRTDGDKLLYRWGNCKPDFNMSVQLSGTTQVWLHPGSNWQTIQLPPGVAIEDYNKNFYITLKKLP